MNVSPLMTGTMVNIWKENRGHNYVVLGTTEAVDGTKSVLLQRNTCLNNNGDIHASCQRIHKTALVEEIDTYCVSNKINRVYGTREFVPEKLTEFVLGRGRQSNFQILKAEDAVYANPEAHDARNTVNY